MAQVINRRKFFGWKLIDFLIVHHKGFVRVVRIYRKYWFGLPLWTKSQYIAEEKKEGTLTLHRPKNFQTPALAVDFVNKELAAIGSAKRYHNEEDTAQTA